MSRCATKEMEQNIMLRGAIWEIAAAIEQTAVLVPLYDDGYRKCLYCESIWRLGRGEKHEGDCTLVMVRQAVRLCSPEKETAL
jgi:hypothetical protein